MKSLWRPHRRQAFTLVEIMIIVALIGLLAVLMIPSFIKDRQRSQGSRIISDARVIDAAINAWALETGQADNAPIDLVSAASYTKLGSISTNDILGNAFQIGTVGPTQVLISSATKSALANANLDWGAY
jgi:type II secretory pathway pseudopilin PulG